ncbi:hypothetical protein [Halobacteriovorax marinus]|nr:hypothetical protein [Halobacteriovorax marinus]
MSRNIKVLITFLFTIYSLNSLALKFSDVEISAAGDFIYEHGLNQESEAGDRLVMRGVELSVFAPVDNNFSGVLTAAAHDEHGETVVELHELYLSSFSLFPRTNIRVGQYFLAIGRLNRFHQHDWVFTRAPKFFRTFFGEEGVLDSGVEVDYLLPFESVYNFTFGFTSGHKWGHSHTEGKKPKTPTHYARLSNFIELDGANGVEIGLTYLGRVDANDNANKLIGIDTTAKWRRGRLTEFLIQSELWYKNEKDQSGERKEYLGWYLFNEYGVSLSHSLGARLDAYKDLSKRNAITNKKSNNISLGASLQHTYTSSEFLKIRTSMAHEFDREEGLTTNKDTRAMLQFIFILGSHPAHSF